MEKSFLAAFMLESILGFM